MARGPRRSLVTFEFDPSDEDLPGQVQSEASSLGSDLERLIGRHPSAPWFSLPFAMREGDLARLQEVALELRANSDVILVLGSPGLESAAHSVIRVLGPVLPEGGPRIEFIGRDWSGTMRLTRLLEWLGERRISLVGLISERFSPLDSACLRILHGHVERRHGPAETARRVVLAGSGTQAPLSRRARDAGLRVLEHPLPLPEPYAALTPAGLLPAALAGVDPTGVLEGARSQARSMEEQDPASLPAVQYALARLLLAEDGRDLEFVGAQGPPWTGLAREAERILAMPLQGNRRIPLPMAWCPEAAPSRRDSWLEGGPLKAFGTWISTPTPDGPAIPEDRLGDGWPGLEEIFLGPLEQRQAQAEAAAWRHAGLPVLTLRMARLDPLSTGALIFFLHCVRGLSSAWHAPEAETKVALSARHQQGKGLPALQAAVRAPKGSEA